MFLLGIGQYLQGALTALGLSVDSFCATAVDAVNIKSKHKWAYIVLICLVFGVFHFIMPTIGYFVGRPFMDTISPYVKWISFGILGAIGLKGLIETLVEWHVSYEDKIGETYGFEARKHILEYVEQGNEVKQIRAILNTQASILSSGTLPEGWCGCGKLETPEQMKDLSRYLKHLSHWLHRKQLREMMNPAEESTREKNRVISLFTTVIIQAFATSLDALAVGFTYAAQSILYSAAWQIFLVFFAVVFIATLVGGALGGLLGEKSQRWANIAGSLVLIGLGIKALF